MVPITEPNCWPNLPPWWLVSSTEVAALLNIRPRELTAWRARGVAPPPVPPMFLQPTQGNPLWHQYGSLRAWVAERTGAAYPGFDTHAEEFLTWAMPVLGDGGSLAQRVGAFEMLLDQARKDLLAGRSPVGVRAEVVFALDVARSRQPLRAGRATGAFLVVPS